MKKALSIIFFILLSTAAFSQAQWIRQQTPITSTLTRIVFVDTLNGWASGDSGHIIHTSNSGTNWILQNTNLDLSIDDLFFLNAFTGWALCNDYVQGTYIIKTTNAGDNWNFTRLSDSSHFFSTIFFNNENTGFLAGNEGAILKTTNAGVNWNISPVDSSSFYRYPIKKITFYNDRIGTASGGAFDIQGVVWQTTNAGASWAASGLGGEPVARVKYKDSLNIIGVGGDHEFGASIVRTTDKGRNWNYSLLGIFGAGYSIDYRIPSEYWIPLGFARAFALSTNGGSNWNSILTPDSTGIYDIIFKSSVNGWCCGVKGRVYKLDEQSVGIRNITNTIPKAFYLSQNFPNPFNPVTKIKFEISDKNSVKLSVYNILGKQASTLVDERLNAGTYEVDLDASSLPSGIYFYTLQAGSFKETKKMLLLK